MKYRIVRKSILENVQSRMDNPCKSVLSKTINRICETPHEKIGVIDFAISLDPDQTGDLRSSKKRI